MCQILHGKTQIKSRKCNQRPDGSPCQKDTVQCVSLVKSLLTDIVPKSVVD